MYQLMLGEWPCHDVLASAAPVLASDLGDAESAGRWPGFAPAAGRLGAGAVFAFPLMVGAIRAGVLDLYRGSPGPLSGRQLGDVLILADAASAWPAGGHGRQRSGIALAELILTTPLNGRWRTPGGWRRGKRV